jgi:hypothetical protein
MSEEERKAEIRRQDYAGSEYPAPTWPLENQPEYTRPWLFEPGDAVLCLIEQAPGGPMIVSGVVQQIRIPGPIRSDQVVQVQMDSDDVVPEEMGLLWWDPDKLERIHG